MLIPALSFLRSLLALESECGAGLFKSSQEQEQVDLNGCSEAFLHLRFLKMAFILKSFTAQRMARNNEIRTWTFPHGGQVVQRRCPAGVTVSPGDVPRPRPLLDSWRQWQPGPGLDILQDLLVVFIVPGQHQVGILRPLPS